MTDYPTLFRDPAECVAALEALRGLVVLGEWEDANTSTYGMQNDLVRPDRGGAWGIAAVAQASDGQWSWQAKIGHKFHFASEWYATPELAKSAADEHLTSLPNVRAVGVEPKHAEL